jgi:hypothetical protein
MLQWTHERGIIVQIEVWDRFDYAEGNWDISPWNPKNNITYDYEESSSRKEYRNDHLYRDTHPFFLTIPGTSRYTSRHDLVRKYQEAFVDKMLSYSLSYGHVLYCMNNETSAEPGWGQFWIHFIKDRAGKKGVTVWATDMFDDAYLGPQAKHAAVVFDDPEHYLFADISQVNSRDFDPTHWDRLQWLLQQVSRHPRPSNHTTIYGCGYYTFGTGGPEDGVERFWRNIIGGSAAARFHRPDAGNGFNDLSRDDTTLVLQASDSHAVFYREDAESIHLDLSAMDGRQPAVALDATKEYAEIDLGTLDPTEQTWRAPYRSDWAIAVGAFPNGTGHRD